MAHCIWETKHQENLKCNVSTSITDTNHVNNETERITRKMTWNRGYKCNLQLRHNYITYIYKIINVRLGKQIDIK